MATTTLPFLSPFRPHVSIRHRNFTRNQRSGLILPSCSTSSSSWEREEARWQREEQRWLREEQRWLREEGRWRAEREALLDQVAALRRRLHQALGSAGGPGAVEAMVVEEVTPIPPRAALVEEAEVKRMVIVEETSKEEMKERRALRAGAEGDDVREMQEALQKLGFYSGEEDMEFSSFSTGTERAVKTWQSSVGSAEDGIMTSELLERLFSERKTGTKDGVNGAAVASVTEVAEIQKTVVQESGELEYKASEHRVFLLGENRWEDPSRLLQKNKPTGNSAVKCVTCRGEGRLMCQECDGSGEPNIEPQFLEWVDAEMKCPYCQGHGYSICDVCAGKAVVET